MCRGLGRSVGWCPGPAPTTSSVTVCGTARLGPRLICPRLLAGAGHTAAGKATLVARLSVVIPAAVRAGFSAKPAAAASVHTCPHVKTLATLTPVRP